ncbi:TIR domain-containing protein [Pseudomonas aeruginosa]|uniref:TIR domain-containing protein n=1 Tax=Pseudomonas aeruginosa TaxID=287 RepID=UPI0013DFC8F7|nr:TIR domain-containing protein [Pseudomonas aeruginosa]MBW0971333.1 TIR domain-containing protein [Pseudomonas aeruginosa]QYE91528.1 TIR domain-containing protein [Pseudomonas aeruginosa]UJC38454.1 TIR domain-containing protein [Pseudomonas aeruginosa]HCL3834061.1 TIR domain-containing protein [Pseudomonas aeruginosa]
MGKAFLSHSSKDKIYVKKVADELGSALCHYDERTFEPSGESAGEILEALDNSSVFVLFLSKNALDSPWVEKEIFYAKHLFFSGQIKEVSIFPLDETARDRLDSWLRPFVVQTLRSPSLAALRIRSQIDSEQHSHPARFIGRDTPLSELKDRLTENSPNKTSAILLSGVNGIGKRRLAKRAYEDLFPFLPKHWIEIELGNYEGESVLYERLLELFATPTDWESARAKTDNFLSLSQQERTAELSKLLYEIEASKQVIVLIFTHEGINAEGNLADWLLSAMRTTKTSYPVLTVSSPRAPSPRALSSLTDIPYIKINSLEEKYARQLFELLCEDLNINAPEHIKQKVISLVGGHPGLLELSAKLIKQVGPERFNIEINSSEGKSALDEYVERAVSFIKPTTLEKIMILLIDELGGATPEDLIFCLSTSSNDSAELSRTLAKIIDFGLIEESGGELRTETHLSLVTRRWRNDKSLRDALSQARRKLIEILDEALSLEGGSYIAIRGPIAAAIREDGEFQHALISKPLLAAQQLRVARRLYDERDLIPAAEKAKKAYENRLALSDDAEIEALRILGLSGARLRNDELKTFSYAELERINSEKAKKISSFIHGFEKRLSGNFKDAEQYLRAALNRGGSGDFHILRELAASLLEQGKPQEAEQYARGALRIAPTNPYVLDILTACLIDRFKEAPKNIDLEDEIDDLIIRLKRSDEREHQTFSIRRETSFEMARANYQKAKILLESDHSNRNKIWHKGLMAECLQKTGNPRAALELLDGLHRPPTQGTSDEALVQFALIRRVRILSLAETGRFDEAVHEYEKASTFLESELRQALKRELIGEIARSPGKKSDTVRQFAITG